MKSTITVLLILSVTGLLFAEDAAAPAKPGSLEHLDAQYGFRDLKFEQSIKSCKGMTLLEDSGEMKFYVRKSDALEQGGVKLKSIEYGFYKGKFANVTLNVAEDADPALLFKSLENDYGPARQSPSKAGKFYWFGQRVMVDFWSGGIGRGTVGWWSKPLQSQQAERK